MELSLKIELTDRRNSAESRALFNIIFLMFCFFFCLFFFFNGKFGGPERGPEGGSRKGVHVLSTPRPGAKKDGCFRRLLYGIHR